MPPPPFHDGSEFPTPEGVLPGIEALRERIQVNGTFHRAAFFFRQCANTGNSPFKVQAMDSIRQGQLAIREIPEEGNYACATKALGDVLEGLGSPENRGLQDLLRLGLARQEQLAWAANEFATIMHKCLEAIRGWRNDREHPLLFLRPRLETDPDFIRGCLETAAAVIRPAIPRPAVAPPSTAQHEASRVHAPTRTGLPAWLPPILGAPEKGRQDTSSLSAAWAAHIGPRHAAKAVNQDAALALVEPVAGTIHFALADGVSSSAGSEVAARVVVQTFCEAMARVSVRPDKATFERATQEALAACLDRLESLLEAAQHGIISPEFKPLLGGLQPIAAQRIFKNTVDRRIPTLGPALACTLVGGSLFPGPGGTARLFFIVVGDGMVECLGTRGDRVLFGMDPEEMVIESAVCPGPIGRSILQSPPAATRVDLRMGDRILVSSDGLQRGHASSLASMLRSRCGEGIEAALDDPRSLLERLAREADREYGSGSGDSCFADNLSLIVLAVES